MEFGEVICSFFFPNNIDFDGFSDRMCLVCWILIASLEFVGDVWSINNVIRQYVRQATRSNNQNKWQAPEKEREWDRHKRMSAEMSKIDGGRQSGIMNGIKGAPMELGETQRVRVREREWEKEREREWKERMDHPEGETKPVIPLEQCAGDGESNLRMSGPKATHRQHGKHLNACLPKIGKKCRAFTKRHIFDESASTLSLCSGLNISCEGNRIGNLCHFEYDIIRCLLNRLPSIPRHISHTHTNTGLLSHRSLPAYSVIPSLALAHSFG